MIIVDVCKRAKENIRKTLKQYPNPTYVERCSCCHECVTIHYLKNSIYNRGCNYKIINDKIICDECFVKMNLISESKYKTLYYEDEYLVVKETRKRKKIFLFRYQYSYVDYFDFAIGV